MGNFRRRYEEDRGSLHTPLICFERNASPAGFLISSLMSLGRVLHRKGWLALLKYIRAGDPWSGCRRFSAFSDAVRFASDG